MTKAMASQRIYPSLRTAGILAVFAVMAACKTSDGLSAATLSALSTTSAELETRVASQDSIISYLATRSPARITLPTGTVVATPYQPVQGLVEIEGGACCVGGTAGDPLGIETTFQAFSPLGEVTHMRVRFGNLPFTEEQFANADWEPFVSIRTFPIEIIPNWVGYYVSVQYMDEEGNTSPIYYDDIAVEGGPQNDLP